MESTRRLGSGIIKGAIVTETPEQLPSCTALAAQLIVEGCLPIIQGTVKGEAPVKPMPLAMSERDKLGLEPGGLTLFYPAGEEGVFVDARADTFLVWFAGGDCANVTSVLHDALMRAFPAARQLDDVAHKIDSRMRARVYRVDLGGGRLAAIHTSFSDAGPGRYKFAARVVAQQRER